jgi:hypothetical protein
MTGIAAVVMGWLFILAGLVGLFLPFLQGIVCRCGRWSAAAVHAPTARAATSSAEDQFGDLPTTTGGIDPRFGTVTEIMSGNSSHYNGVTVSLRRRFSTLQFQANYTYSHVIDVISNDGLLPFNGGTNLSILNPQDPFNPARFNYGNADYDVRHYASLNYVWTTPKLTGWRSWIASWTVSVTVFTRSGLPFSPQMVLQPAF